MQIASCLAGEGSDAVALPAEVVAIAVRCLTFALDGLKGGDGSMHSGFNATSYARTAYGQLGKIMHIRESFDGCSGLLEDLASQWQPTILLDVAELYWWSTDSEHDHRTFLSALLKRVKASGKTCDDANLCSVLQSVLERVQQASASVRAAAATCMSGWLVDFVTGSTESLRPRVVHAALRWLHTMHCDQWHVQGHSCTAAAFCELKTIYMQQLLEEKKYAQLMQFVHAAAQQFTQLSATTASPDLHAQLTCILSMEGGDVWLQVQRVLSTTDLPTQEQLQILLPQLVKSVNACALLSQGKVCPRSASLLQAWNIPVAPSSRHEGTSLKALGIPADQGAPLWKFVSGTC